MNLLRCWVLLLLPVLSACGIPSSSPEFVRVSESGFTGVARCAACHTNNYAEWKQSLHHVAMTVPTDSTVVGNFDGAVHTYGGVTSRMFKRDGQFFMETKGADGQIQTYRVDYTIGVRQHQAYVTRFDDGRYQVLPLYHDGPQNAWVDAQEGGVVEQHRPLSPTDFYYWANAGRTWNFHCFDCHASRVEKNYDIENNRYHSSVGSLSIDCEACHGPSMEHDKTRGKVGEPLHLVELEKLNKEQAVEVCTQCHAAKEIVATGYLPGKDFYDFYQLILPDDGKVFYPDGQPRVYLYPGALHLMSPCFTNDDLRCTTCHDSHGNARDVDLVADRDGVGLCESCHEDVTKNPVAHGHHKPGSKGNQCVPCHMPYHHVTGEHLTDHRIESPVPQNTVENGVPNACNQSGCHADQSAQWASQWATTWYGAYQDGVVRRTKAVVLAQHGDRSAVPVLLELVDDFNAIWRATAVALLGRLGDARAVPHLRGLLKTDTHPMVRLKAAISLGQIGDMRALPALISALSDSSLSVRIQVPFALMDMGYVPNAAEAKTHIDRVLAEYQTVVSGVQGDDPGFHESLGQVYERQGRFDEAEREFEIVGQLDPRHPETAADLARIKKERVRFEMLQKQVSQSALPYAKVRLGALLLHAGRYQDAQEAFDGLSEVPASALFQTMRGDVLLGRGDYEGAQKAYFNALNITPEFRPAVRRVAQMALLQGGDFDIVQGDLSNKVTRGVEVARTGDWSEAAQVFAQVLHAEALGNITWGLSRDGLRWVGGKADSAVAEGRSFYAQGDLQRALSFFDRAIGFDPERSDVYALQGLILADLGDLKMAEQRLCDALLIDPGNASALTLLGTVYQERGLLNDALGLYEQAWALNEGAPGLAFLLGQLYFAQGNKDRARVMLQRAVQEEPNNMQTKELLRQLGNQEL